MQAVGTMSTIGLGRRFRPAGALATQLRAEEYLSQHIVGRPLYTTASQPHRSGRASQALPFDDNAHNRFHRQQEPLRNPLAPPSAPAAAAASAPAPAAAHQPQPRPRPFNKRRGCGPEDDSRKGVLGARLRKQQQQQQQESHHLKGSAWLAQVAREERRASRSKGPKGAAAGAGAAAPSASSRRPAAAAVSAFRRAYDEGRLPCSILHHPVAVGARGSSMVKWHVSPEALDARVYLPLFLSGLLETKDPYRFLAIQGALDLIKASKEQLPSSLAHILPPIKAALAAPDPIIVATALKILQDLVLADPLRVGPALVPHYHSLVGAGAAVQRHKDTTGAKGDAINYTQFRRLCLRRLVNETLELLELTGGAQAFVHIRYMIPTYERTVRVAC